MSKKIDNKTYKCLLELLWNVAQMKGPFSVIPAQHAINIITCNSQNAKLVLEMLGERKEILDG